MSTSADLFFTCLASCQAMRQHHFLYYVPGGMWSAAVEIPVRWLCLCEYDRLQDSYVGDWLPFQVSVRLDRSIYDGPCSLIYKPPSTPLSPPIRFPIKQTPVQSIHRGHGTRRVRRFCAARCLHPLPDRLSYSSSWPAPDEPRLEPAAVRPTVQRDARRATTT
jgi:hypothetical protein